MRGKAFSEARGIDDPLRKAVIEALGGHEPDNFIQSALGGAVDGPPDSRAEAEELKLIQELDERLQKEIVHAEDVDEDE